MMLYYTQQVTTVYIVGNFRGVQFTRIGHLESFRGFIFEVAQDLRHIHIILYRHVKKIVGLIFVDTPRSTKTTKINTLKNFLLYGI